MLGSHNNLHLKWHTRSNISVQSRNGQQTWILTWLCPKFYRSGPLVPLWPGRLLAEAWRVISSLWGWGSIVTTLYGPRSNTGAG